MLRDDKLEEFFSPYTNPLTLVIREMKPLRICVDARRINRQMIAYRTKVLPLRELLQKFHEASYITSMDLSSAFLQVSLKTDSRTWTVFQFQGKVYHYKTSIWVQEQLSRIYSGCGKGLGDDKIKNHLVMYVDDLVHSSTF
jgi:hypothetical protein